VPIALNGQNDRHAGRWFAFDTNNFPLPVSSFGSKGAGPCGVIITETPASNMREVYVEPVTSGSSDRFAFATPPFPWLSNSTAQLTVSGLVRNVWAAANGGVKGNFLDANHNSAAPNIQLYFAPDGQAFVRDTSTAVAPSDTLALEGTRTLPAPLVTQSGAAITGAGQSTLSTRLPNGVYLQAPPGTIRHINLFQGTFTDLTGLRLYPQVPLRHGYDIGFAARTVLPNDGTDEVDMETNGMLAFPADDVRVAAYPGLNIVTDVCAHNVYLPGVAAQRSVLRLDGAGSLAILELANGATPNTSGAAMPLGMFYYDSFIVQVNGQPPGPPMLARAVYDEANNRIVSNVDPTLLTFVDRRTASYVDDAGRTRYLTMRTHFSGGFEGTEPLWTAAPQVLPQTLYATPEGFTMDYQVDGDRVRVSMDPDIAPLYVETPAGVLHAVSTYDDSFAGTHGTHGEARVGASFVTRRPLGTAPNPARVAWASGPPPVLSPRLLNECVRVAAAGPPDPLVGTRMPCCVVSDAVYIRAGGGGGSVHLVRHGTARVQVSAGTTVDISPVEPVTIPGDAAGYPVLEYRGGTIDLTSGNQVDDASSAVVTLPDAPTRFACTATPVALTDGNFGAVEAGLAFFETAAAVSAPQDALPFTWLYTGVTPATDGAPVWVRRNDAGNQVFVAYVDEGTGAPAVATLDAATPAQELLRPGTAATNVIVGALCGPSAPSAIQRIGSDVFINASSHPGVALFDSDTLITPPASAFATAPPAAAAYLQSTLGASSSDTRFALVAPGQRVTFQVNGDAAAAVSAAQARELVDAPQVRVHYAGGNEVVYPLLAGSLQAFLRVQLWRAAAASRAAVLQGVPLTGGVLEAYGSGTGDSIAVENYDAMVRTAAVPQFLVAGDVGDAQFVNVGALMAERPELQRLFAPFTSTLSTQGRQSTRMRVTLPAASASAMLITDTTDHVQFLEGHATVGVNAGGRALVLIDTGATFDGYFDWDPTDSSEAAVATHVQAADEGPVFQRGSPPAASQGAPPIVTQQSGPGGRVTIARVLPGQSYQRVSGAAVLSDGLVAVTPTGPFSQVVENTTGEVQHVQITSGFMRVLVDADTECLVGEARSDAPLALSVTPRRVGTAANDGDALYVFDAAGGEFLRLSDGLEFTGETAVFGGHTYAFNDGGDVLYTTAAPLSSVAFPVSADSAVQPRVFLQPQRNTTRLVSGAANAATAVVHGAAPATLPQATLLAPDVTPANVGVTAARQFAADLSTTGTVQRAASVVVSVDSSTVPHTLTTSSVDVAHAATAADALFAVTQDGSWAMLRLDGAYALESGAFTNNAVDATVRTLSTTGVPYASVPAAAQGFLGENLVRSALGFADAVLQHEILFGRVRFSGGAIPGIVDGSTHRVRFANVGDVPAQFTEDPAFPPSTVPGVTPVYRFTHPLPPNLEITDDALSAEAPRVFAVATTTYLAAQRAVAPTSIVNSGGPTPPPTDDSDEDGDEQVPGIERYLPAPTHVTAAGVTVFPVQVNQVANFTGRRQRLPFTAFACFAFMAQNPTTTTPADVAFAVNNGCPVQLVASLRLLPTRVPERVFTLAARFFGVVIPFPQR